jgi:aquaglyceroporin related protein, other eukaryote
MFVLAQILGGVVGACLSYGNYLGAIDVAEGGGKTRTIPGQYVGAAGTAGMFATFAVSSSVLRACGRPTQSTSDYSYRT